MKSWVLFLLLYPFQSYGTSELCLANEDPFYVFTDTISDVLSELRTGESPGNEFINCSQGETSDYQRALTYSLTRNQEILTDLNREAPSHPDLSGHLNQARRKLECIIRKLPNLKIECTTDSYQGLAFPLLGRRIYMNTQECIEGAVAHHRRTTEKVLNIVNYIGAVLTHEAGHKCGANDAAYFRENSPNNVGFSRWSTIADTYAYWNKWGFCVPGRTCAESHYP